MRFDDIHYFITLFMRQPRHFSAISVTSAERAAVRHRTMLHVVDIATVPTRRSLSLYAACQPPAPRRFASLRPALFSPLADICS